MNNRKCTLERVPPYGIRRRRDRVTEDSQKQPVGLESADWLAGTLLVLLILAVGIIIGVKWDDYRPSNSMPRITWVMAEQPKVRVIFTPTGNAGLFYRIP